MSQTITLTKSEYEKLTERLTTLEKWIFGKNQILRTIKQYEDEKRSGKLIRLRRVEELFEQLLPSITPLLSKRLLKNTLLIASRFKNASRFLLIIPTIPA